MTITYASLSSSTPLLRGVKNSKKNIVTATSLNLSLYGFFTLFIINQLTTTCIIINVVIHFISFKF